MRVAILHNPVADRDDPSTADVLAQVDYVETALADMGVPAQRVAVESWRPWEDLARIKATAPPVANWIRGVRPVRSAELEEMQHGGIEMMVFNLVEAPPANPAVHPGTAAAIELLGLPFTGSGAAALWLTTDKLATRALLAAEGLPVAPGGRLDLDAPTVLDRVPPPWILKPACEDASLGLDGEAVCTTRAAALARGAELVRRFPGQSILLERYLPGRELNVSLLDEPLITLPVGEIEFVDFPAGMPRIVGYEAKWDDESFEYRHTVRRFPDEPADQPLLAEARRLALAAWRACGLSGYGRVDLRLDEHGQPHILEVNANPCLAADAGFAAAARQAGLSAPNVVRRILAAALARHGRTVSECCEPVSSAADERTAAVVARI